MKKFISFFIFFCFIVTGIIGPCPVYAQDFVLPAPGVMVRLSPQFNPPILKGIKIHPDNPFKFDFILDAGDDVSLSLKEQSTKLIKYFLASLTIPEKDLWVNLSPYEKDRIIPPSFGLTEMGRDLLAEDYFLKQITASLIYPEDEIGKKFWKMVYEEAVKRYGTTNISVNTFNKVWIVPEKAVVYENAKAGTAYVVESKLKVMLEQDYLSLQKHEGISSEVQTPGKDTNQLGSQIVRAIVIPQLTKEVNEGSNFARLRQVYSSLILATWYKKKIKDSLLRQIYTDQNKIKGTEYQDSVISRGRSLNDVEAIYRRYLSAFKKGVFNYIKEDPSLPLDGGLASPAGGGKAEVSVPRKYFSGGFTAGKFYMDRAMVITTDWHYGPKARALVVRARLNITGGLPSVDLAMAKGPGNNVVSIDSVPREASAAQWEQDFSAAVLSGDFERAVGILDDVKKKSENPTPAKILEMPGTTPGPADQAMKANKKEWAKAIVFGIAASLANAVALGHIAGYGLKDIRASDLAASLALMVGYSFLAYLHLHNSATQKYIRGAAYPQMERYLDSMGYNKARPVIIDMVESFFKTPAGRSLSFEDYKVYDNLMEYLESKNRTDALMMFVDLHRINNTMVLLYVMDRLDALVDRIAAEGAYEGGLGELAGILLSYTGDHERDDVKIRAEALIEKIKALRGSVHQLLPVTDDKKHDPDHFSYLITTSGLNKFLVPGTNLREMYYSFNLIDQDHLATLGNLPIGLIMGFSDFDVIAVLRHMSREIRTGGIKNFVVFGRFLDLHWRTDPSNVLYDVRAGDEARPISADKLFNGPPINNGHNFADNNEILVSNNGSLKIKSAVLVVSQAHSMRQILAYLEHAGDYTRIREAIADGLPVVIVGEKGMDLTESKNLFKEAFPDRREISPNRFISNGSNQAMMTRRELLKSAGAALGLKLTEPLAKAAQALASNPKQNIFLFAYEHPAKLDADRLGSLVNEYNLFLDGNVKEGSKKYKRRQEIASEIKEYFQDKRSAALLDRLRIRYGVLENTIRENPDIRALGMEGVFMKGNGNFHKENFDDNMQFAQKIQHAVAGLLANESPGTVSRIQEHMLLLLLRPNVYLALYGQDSAIRKRIADMQLVPIENKNFKDLQDMSLNQIRTVMGDFQRMYAQGLHEQPPLLSHDDYRVLWQLSEGLTFSEEDNAKLNALIDRLRGMEGDKKRLAEAGKLIKAIDAQKKNSRFFRDVAAMRSNYMADQLDVYREGDILVVTGLGHVPQIQEALEREDKKNKKGRNIVPMPIEIPSATTATPPTGGIDLTAGKIPLKIRTGASQDAFGDDSSIQFHFDPAMLQQLRDAPGFVPVIIDIQPINDLKGFLDGISLK